MSQEESEFKQRFRAVVDKVLTGCETQNVMQVIGGAFEAQSLVTDFFGREWVETTFARGRAIQQWATSPAGQEWFAGAIAPMFDIMRGPK